MNAPAETHETTLAVGSQSPRSSCPPRSSCSTSFPNSPAERTQIMREDVIPAAARLAARRAFVRTTAQAYAASLTVGLLTSVVSLIVDPSQWIPVIVAVILALLAPVLSGLVAYFQWLAKGIPEEYELAAEEEGEAP